MNARCSTIGLAVHAGLMVLLALPALSQSTSPYDRALAEFSAGHYPAAAEMFSRVEAQSPGTTDALLYRAKSLVHMQDFHGAETALQNYLPAHQNSSDALYMLGFVLNRQNRPAESLAFYTRAAAIAKPASDDLKVVGLDYVLLNDYPDAIKWLEKAVRLDGSNQDAWYFLGRAYYTKSQLAEARRAFQAILDLDPVNVRAEDNLGLIFETEGKPDQALAAYQKAISWQDQSGVPNEQPYVNLGNLLAEQGRLQDAIPPLEKAVTVAPASAYCHMTLGVTYRKNGQMEKARKELVRAAELGPDDPNTHYQLGRLYKDMNDLDRAKKEFDKTSELKNRAAGQENR